MVYRQSASCIYTITKRLNRYFASKTVFLYRFFIWKNFSKVYFFVFEWFYMFNKNITSLYFNFMTDDYTQLII